MLTTQTAVVKSRIRFWMVRFAERMGWLSFVDESVVDAYMAAATAAHSRPEAVRRIVSTAKDSVIQYSPNAFALLAKRAMDIMIAGLAVLFVSPVFLLIALLIRTDSRGPVFFVSEYVGEGGRLIRLFRFRTMVVDRGRLRAISTALDLKNEIVFRLRNDPRITRIGRILRKYSLDELPLLLSVLRGDLSLVGPRPPLASLAITQELEYSNFRGLRPGITGLWQVQSRHDPSFQQFAALNRAYAEHWSLGLDFKILIATASAISGATVRIVENSPQVFPRPEGFRRDDFEIPRRDDEWVVTLATERSL